MNAHALILAAAGALALAAAARAGDPGRGAVVWQEQHCGSCHTFAAADSTGTAAPRIERWLAPQAASAKLPVGAFALARVTYGGRGMPAFGRELDRTQLDDLVSFLTGSSFTAPDGGVAPVPSFDPPPPLVTASRKTVAGWIGRGRLTGDAARGAAVFAREGCLSCHAYRGSGRPFAPALTAYGRRAASIGRLVAYLARPYRFGNTAMPAYADLPAGELAALASFLRASR